MKFVVDKNNRPASTSDAVAKLMSQFRFTLPDALKEVGLTGKARLPRTLRKSIAKKLLKPTEGLEILETKALAKDSLLVKDPIESFPERVSTRNKFRQWGGPLSSKNLADIQKFLDKAVDHNLHVGFYNQPSSNHFGSIKLKVNPENGLTEFFVNKTKFADARDIKSIQISKFS